MNHRSLVAFLFAVHAASAAAAPAPVRADALGIDGIYVGTIGLQLDTGNPILQQGLASIREGHDSRAHRIAESLASAGIAGAYLGARKYVTSERLISRSQIAAPKSGR